VKISTEIRGFMCNKETALVMSLDLKGAGDTLWRHLFCHSRRHPFQRILELKG